MENQLIKKKYRGAGNADKYYIDCSQYNSETIIPEMIIQNKKSLYQEVTILQAVATNDTIRKYHRHIVVKIGRNLTKDISMVYKEFEIGKSLEKFTGFLKYICIFSCFDDTINKFGHNDTKIRPISGKICNADEKINENFKYVLVMPYIKEGAIGSYNWTIDNIEILKNLIIHTILSMTVAFFHTGFIHGDLHLHNVLLKKTKLKNNDYFLHRNELSHKDVNNDIVINEPFMGYKPIIMDFEKAKIGVYNLHLFWQDLHQFTKNIDGMENKINQRVFWKEESQIISFIIECKNNEAPLRNVLILIEKIKNSTLKLNEKYCSFSYNPNIF